MLVHVKKPRINVCISGEGEQLVLDSLRKTYSDLEVTDEDKAVDIEKTSWYRITTEALTVGEILATYRGNADITLDQLAEKSGIPKSNLSAMENDKRTIGPKTARKLADVFGCDYRCFFLD
ncbi:MAG: helix-turn-helix transcriptional regulator [Spirochaetales bacterium]|nr:helix-turn-helix transcriptional regulator [Spirochaetales bacterium]